MASVLNASLLNHHKNIIALVCAQFYFIIVAFVTRTLGAQ